MMIGMTKCLRSSVYVNSQLLLDSRGRGAEEMQEGGCPTIAFRESQVSPLAWEEPGVPQHLAT